MTALFDSASAGGAAAGAMSDGERAQRLLDDARANHSIRLALEHATQVGGRSGLQLLAGFRNRIAAAEAEILADHVQDNGDNRRAQRLLDDGKTSRAEQRRRAARASAVAANSGLASKLADGDLNEEQLDVIADASARTDGDAAVDDDLIDEIGSVPPERGKSIVDDYVAERATRDGVQTEHQRQRALRRASKYHNKNKGLDSIALDGDGVSSKLAWSAIEKRANEIYERDGARDLPHSKHPRTRDQRLFDAAFELLTGQITTPAGQTTPDTTASSTKPANAPSTPTRPQIVIDMTVDHLTGDDPAAIATQIGLGHIPDSVVANYAANADIFAALYDRNGEPLWLARLNRYASATQRIALILRDRGCVLCGADHTRCQVHHTMPWNAPGKGRTNLDELVLLCEPCHQRLHADQQTIHQDPQGEWRTRPATPNEIPPARPGSSHNTPRRE